MAHAVSDEVRYELLQYLETHPDASQRELARALGISLGKVNYCLRALMNKGWLKVRNFGRSRNKSAYAYVLTSKGIEEKVNLTYSFLRRKMADYDLLRQEIERLTAEVVKIEQRS
jgi:EPS-associated MarR family transcriptional regulator